MKLAACKILLAQVQVLYLIKASQSAFYTITADFRFNHSFHAEESRQCGNWESACKARLENDRRKRNLCRLTRKLI